MMSIDDPGNISSPIGLASGRMDIYNVKDARQEHLLAIDENIRLDGMNRRDCSKNFRVLFFRCCRTLDQVDSGDEFMKVWTDCLKSHYHLWKGGVHHRDISARNLLWYQDGKDIVGVLNDFDLATMDDEGSGGAERTGTVPFMALDLLFAVYRGREISRLYRHDLESFIWVFVWYHLDQSVIANWQTADHQTCYTQKLSFVVNAFTLSKVRFSKLQEQWKDVGGPLMDWVFASSVKAATHDDSFDGPFMAIKKIVPLL